MQNSSKKLRVIFVGMPDMATVCLGALQKHFNICAVIPPPKFNPTSKSFCAFAKMLGLEVIEYDVTPNSPKIINKIKEKNADIGVICSFDKLLNKDFLNTTKMGYINCHPSLLPHYRGANPYFHIINNGEKMSGITLHFADENFDTGEIIMQKGVILEERETIGTLFNRCNYTIADMLIKVLSDIQNGAQIVTKKQPEGNFKTAPKIEGSIKIDLSKTGCEIERLTRAANPFYNAYIIFRGTELKILSVDYKKEAHNLEYGITTKVDKNLLEITVQDGYIYPRTVQSGSWGIFQIADFISIFRPKQGERFL